MLGSGSLWFTYYSLHVCALNTITYTSPFPSYHLSLSVFMDFAGGRFQMPILELKKL